MLLLLSAPSTHAFVTAAMHHNTVVAFLTPAVCQPPPLVHRHVTYLASNKEHLERARWMSDKPKPGKDKDLRYIRQAIEEADALFELLGGDFSQGGASRSAELVAEAMLTVIEQIDLLDQMLGEPAAPATTVIDYNRKLRDLIRAFLAADLPAAMRPKVTRMAQVSGNQLKSLLIVKEIRRPD